MTEQTQTRESKKIRRVLKLVGYKYFDSASGQKVDLSFLDENPYQYNGIKAYSFTMTSAWLKQLTDYSKVSMGIGCYYDVITKYNFDFKADYIVAIYPHQELDSLPQFNVKVEEVPF
jgi:hypothetical protein